MTKLLRNQNARLLLIVGIAVLLLGSMYAYREFNRTIVETADAKTSSSHTASDLLSKLNADSNFINMVSGKVLEVKGQIKSVEGTPASKIIYLGDADQSGSIRCHMDSSAVIPGNLIEGSVLTVKGTCIGYEQDSLLGNDIIMNRCIVMSNR